jgi:hypothetical protein
MLTWLAMLAAGVTFGKRWPATVGLAILAACAAMPVVLLNHVSELYAYNLAPFAAIIVALALPPLMEVRRTLLVRALTTVFLLGVLFSHVVAVKRKASQFEANGRDAVVLVPLVIDFARQLPPSGVLVLCEPPHPATMSYSEFLGGPFMGINDGADGRNIEKWVKHRAQRPDISIKFVADLPHESADMILVPDGSPGTLRVLTLPTSAGP